MNTEAYQREAMLMREAVDAAFPNYTRVKYRGRPTGNWSGTVQTLTDHGRRSTAADMVFVIWDNGNRYAVCVDDIEVLK